MLFVVYDSFAVYVNQKSLSAGIFRLNKGKSGFSVIEMAI